MCKVVVVGGNGNATGSGARAASLANIKKLSRSLNQRLLLRLEHLQWCSICDSAKMFPTSKCRSVSNFFFCVATDSSTVLCKQVWAFAAAVVSSNVGDKKNSFFSLMLQGDG